LIIKQILYSDALLSSFKKVMPNTSLTELDIYKCSSQLFPLSRQPGNS